MIRVFTFFTSALFLGIARGEVCKPEDGVNKVLTALQSNTYYLTGTTNSSREACYYVTATEPFDACQSGTQVTYGYKKNGREWVNSTGVVSGTGNVFSSDIHGPLCGMTVEARGGNCFTLRNNNATEMWVTKESVDTPPSCCKEAFDTHRGTNRYQTTYEGEVC
uniref:Putative salivary lipocalin n=1 Tax=Ornithodoros turicata TaxID=34597 RepID=A0A2R5LB33_9ACAR